MCDGSQSGWLTAPARRPPPALLLRRITKNYPAGDTEVRVLHGIDLAVGRGEFVSIMGPSGSGKSTMLNMVGLLDTPTAGQIVIDGTVAGGLNANQRAIVRREKLGFVFQSFNLMARQTALQNVMLPLALARMPRAERKKRGMGLLNAVGLADRASHLPAKLSGGQRQRVAIARALALDPPIILADEPTGNLDSKTSGDIMNLFERLHRQGRTIIQVTHDLNMARHGTRLIALNDGRIVRDARRPPA